MMHREAARDVPVVEDVDVVVCGGGEGAPYFGPTPLLQAMGSIPQFHSGPLPADHARS